MYKRQQLSLTATLGSKIMMTICQNLVIFQTAQDVAGDYMFLKFTTEARPRVLLNRIVRIGEISSAMSRIILAGIISSPQALLGFIFFRSFSTPSLVSVITGNGGIRLTVNTWNVSLIFSGVDRFLLMVKYVGFIHRVCMHLASVLKWCNPTVVLLWGLYEGPERFCFPGLSSMSGSPGSITSSICCQNACPSALCIFTSFFFEVIYMFTLFRLQSVHVFPHRLCIQCNRKLLLGIDDLCIICLKRLFYLLEYCASLNRLFEIIPHS